jgi:hypothetical protein
LIFSGIANSKLTYFSNFAEKNDLKYSIVPIVKEIIYTGKANNPEVRKLVEKVIFHVGAKNFEGLPNKTLYRYKNSVFSFLLGRKLFSKRKLNTSLKYFEKVRPSSRFYPLALQYQAVIKYMNRNYTGAIANYSKCVEVSEERMDSNNDYWNYRKVKVNRDLCLVGKARVYYAQKKYDLSDLAYLDLEKKSIIWPSILVEEAWSSYYRKNYNRSLGKLVSYNAPLLKFIVKPELYVLRAMSYLKLCLYNDVKREVDDFYGQYERFSVYLNKLVAKKNNPIYFYNLLATMDDVKVYNLRRALDSIAKSPNIKQYIKNLNQAVDERVKISKLLNRQLRLRFIYNLNEFIYTQKKVLGILVRNKLKKYSIDLDNAFKSMGYLKLEVLGFQKQAIYKGVNDRGKRGEVRYLKRNKKQYFWNFNGEFWGDELGDYVFALPSVCRKN